MFNCDHGSLAEKGPDPGKCEAARPVEIVAFSQDLLLLSCELMWGSAGASTRVQCFWWLRGLEGGNGHGKCLKP